jgi:hypothetical protein
MSYSYPAQRHEVFTEDGQVMFLQIRDTAKRLLALAGAVCVSKLLHGVAGNTWTQLACVDRLEELGELERVDNGRCATQDQVYVAGSRAR